MLALVDAYRKHLLVLNYSHTTVKGHLFALKKFMAYLAGKEIAAVTRETIQAYQTHLYEEINAKGHPNAAASQNNMLKVVKSFFAFLHEQGYIVSDPARDVSYARLPKRLPRSVLTSSEMKKLLHTPDTKTLLGYRDRAILEVLYSSGIRKEEINNLLTGDADFMSGFLRINAGKGNKDRVVPIGKIACRYLENYITAVRPVLLKDPRVPYLFLSLKGGRLSKNMVWQIVKRYAHQACIRKTVSPHTFRHTCATLMLRNRANIRHIQEMLGHASLTSTQVYTSLSITDLKEVHSKCHPREKDKD